MKTLLLSQMLFLALFCPANAETKKLKGDAADDFIHKYMPDASIPGQVKGTIRCNVPAMGGRSNGEVSTCIIGYH